MNRGLYEADAHNGRFSVELTFTYSSRGTLVTRTFDVPLHDARPEDDADARASFVELTIPLDVGDAVPDAGAAIDGEIVLVRTSGDGRVVVDVSRLTAGG
ncbi:hypothetical protein J421_5996 (plasmid) [Gemmatirosa kalamazoonensis]|uniref:Uncharacterized protein n=1 Tax=Gemmatirosa kalamazoonensis TaxID=861299 RepID=W0RS51_9BACT|nr:hypothetical protein [Gemmatirosa kalamazoonensis]AHG93531.1 hypothetical protein J421_5996 [Gemmatirosa kalamazoonensis]